MKFKIERIKNILLKILNKFWHKLFLILILLLVFDVLIGVILFSCYCSNIEQEETKFYLPLKINQDLINQLSSEYGKREKIFNQAKEKIYPDFFQGVGSEEVIIDGN